MALEKENKGKICLLLLEFRSVMAIFVHAIGGWGWVVASILLLRFDVSVCAESFSDIIGCFIMKTVFSCHLH